MDTGVSQVSGPDLGDVACPQCGEVGTLEVQSLLTSRPLGTWSLAGTQLKTSARYVPHIVCTVSGCDFMKAPSKS